MKPNPQIGSYDYFQRLYDVEEKHWWSRGMRDIAGSLFESVGKTSTPLSVLDAGCGTGINLGWLRRYRPGRLVGIDISFPALEFCLRRGERSLLQSSVLALPFRDRAFDLVVCNDVLQHLPGRGGETKALEELYRVLKDGGYLLIRTNSKSGSECHEDVLVDLDYRRYEIRGLFQLLSGAGFEIVRATHANALMSFVAVARDRLQPGRSRHTHNGSQTANPGLSIKLLPGYLQWLNSPLSWLMKCEARILSRPGKSIGFGQTIFFLARRPAVT
jgi:ubiquinone/menaquinone biosynthesis C-methylase UbiE